MAQYRDDFSSVGSPVGAAPSNWTQRWDSPSFLNVSTVADSTAPGGVAMRLDNVTSSSRCLISFDDIDTESPDTRDDIEILFSFKSADVTATAGYTIGGTTRGSGTSTTETGYNWRLYQSFGEMHFTRFSAGGFSHLVTEEDLSAWFDVDANQWLWLRMRSNGSSHRIKIWQQEEPGPAAIHRYEPLYWQYDYTDATITAAGWAGIQVSNINAGPWDIGYFGCGTNGDAAPYPGGADLVTMRMSQQVVQAAVEMASAEIRVKQQACHILVQENIPPPSNAKRRPVIIGM